ncbi:toxin-antitoxin system TumE family protein [Azospirillum sp. sgz301742]
MAAHLIVEDRVKFPDGAILTVRIWEVPHPVPPSTHRFKYSLFYGHPGNRVVGYDNERGKGDHRHLGDVETPYVFTTWESLLDDFLADVAQVRGEGGP